MGHALSLLAADARVKAAGGNQSRAFEDVAAMIRMGRHVQEFLAGPWGMMTQARAWRTLEDVLRLAPAAKEPLPSVPFDEAISPLRIVYQEMAVFAMIWPVVAQSPLRLPELRRNVGPLANPPLVYPVEALVIPGFRIFLMPDELKSSHRTWEAYRRVVNAPGEETPQDWVTLRKAVETEPTGILSAVFMKPKEQKLLRDAGQLAALGQLARAGLAATRYRDKYGKYPERLEQLVPDFLPAMPVDPRDGQMLRLKRFPEAIVLYTLQSSAKLEKENSWNLELHRNEPLFRLPPRAAK
jgi:hypothetical protein